MSENIVEDLGQLDDEDMIRVQRLIAKLANQKNEAVDTDGPKRVRKTQKNQKKRRQPVDERDSDSKIAPRKGGRIGRKRKAEASDTDTGPRRGRRGSGGSKGEGRPGGKPGRREAIQVGEARENRFLEMDAAHSHNKDAEDDKKLAGKNRVTERSGQANLVEIECSGSCGYIYEVNPALIFNDKAKGPTFICNDCANRRR